VAVPDFEMVCLALKLYKPPRRIIESPPVSVFPIAVEKLIGLAKVPVPFPVGET
jgi:hypothetical protein